MTKLNEQEQGPNPLVEELSRAAHEAWMESKHAQGITSRVSEWGAELMVPYEQLSEMAKDLDRGTVRGVLDAIARAGYEVARLQLMGRIDFRGVRFCRYAHVMHPDTDEGTAIYKRIDVAEPLEHP